jgi:hypothetical protein
MIEVSYTLCNNLFFKSGSISRLKLVNLDFIESSKISFVETKIHLPRFSNFDISKIDITRANIDFKTFQLLNDYESDIGIYSKNQAKRNYLEARDTYYLINKQFQNADLDDSQIELEFLMNEAYVKSLNHNFSNFFYIVWNKYFRGHYGLSPSVVILTALKIWILFGIIYIFIGQFTNVGWALFIPINIYGKPIENMQPRFLNQNKWKLSMSYVSYCFLFSMQQLLIPGFSNSGLSFFKGIGLSQKLLIPIGIGKLISFLEYILGLILIFNFIQAFIRTL